MGCLIPLQEAQADKLPIAISRDSKHRIPDLNFGSPKFVKADPELSKELGKYYVLLTGNYPKPDWELYLNGEKMRWDSSRRFEARIAIRSRLTELKFVAKGPDHEEVAETLSIFVIDWDGTLEKVLFGRPMFELTPALGFSYYSYQQSRISDFTEWSVSGKLEASYIYGPPNWSLLATVSGDFFSIASNSGAVSARLLNVDLVTGYSFNFGDSGVSAAVMPGFHYKTLFVTSDQFGYFNLAGPQLHTNLKYQFQAGDSIGAFLKLGPLVRNGRLLSLSNFEFALGAGPTFLLKSGHSMPVLLETSFLTLDFDSMVVKAFHAMLTLGYSL